MSAKKRSSGHRSPATENYDVPFFTVAHYKSPTATPVTYEFAAPHHKSNPSLHQPSNPRPIQRYGTSNSSSTTPVGTPPNYTHSFSPSSSFGPHTQYHQQFGSPRSNPLSPLGCYRMGTQVIPPSIPENFANSNLSFEDAVAQQFSNEGAGESLCSEGLERSMSPVSLAFGPSMPGESWWPPDDIISPSDNSTDHFSQLNSSNSRLLEDSKRSRSRERSNTNIILEAPLQERLHTETEVSNSPIRQPVNFTISPPARQKRKKTPDPIERVKSSCIKKATNIGVAKATKVYEDANVTDALEELFPADDSQHHDKSGHESSDSLTDSLEDIRIDKKKKQSKSGNSPIPPSNLTRDQSSLMQKETTTSMSECRKVKSPVKDTLNSSTVLKLSSNELDLTKRKCSKKPLILPKPSAETILATHRKSLPGVFTSSDVSKQISLLQRRSSVKDSSNSVGNSHPENYKSNNETFGTNFPNLRKSSFSSQPISSKEIITRETVHGGSVDKGEMQSDIRVDSNLAMDSIASLDVVDCNTGSDGKNQSINSEEKFVLQTGKKNLENNSGRDAKCGIISATDDCQPKPPVDCAPDNQKSKTDNIPLTEDTICKMKPIRKTSIELKKRKNLTVKCVPRNNQDPSPSPRSSDSSRSADATPRTPRTPRTKSREPSFSLELDYSEFPESEAEYLALLHAKIAEAHERQLLPLKEDVADWLSKLLVENDLDHTNLMEKIGSGVLLCRLADIVTAKAEEARRIGQSELEVPCLPYKTWDRARQGTFFARDNISNFLRFCRRLGVHEHLLFETEDIVSGSGARSVVLCLLEIGRLAQNWWGLEPPSLVKMEKELEGEEWSARSDSGYSNTSSPRGSTLALNPSHAPHTPPVSEEAHKNTPSRPKSSHIPISASRLSLLSSSSPSSSPSSVPSSEELFRASEFKMPRGKSSIAYKPRTSSSRDRGPKPAPPPKPASLSGAVCNIGSISGGCRPTSLSSGIPIRNWSGSKTTPNTPVSTPTHTPRSRLPIAKTPRTSGRSTPNTTPTTPTQCRRYLSSARKATPSTRPPPKTPVSVSRTTPRNTANFSTPLGRPPPCTPLSSRSSHCVRSKEDTRQLNRDLDVRVQDIARQTRGVCICTESNCSKSHIKKLSDGKYDVYGRSVYVRLLKDKHVMVRVGGGWDTLEHYVLSHDPTQVTLFNSKGAEPFLHIRSRYRSPTPSKSISKVSRILSAKFEQPKETESVLDIPPQPDFDASFGSTQSLSNASSQSDLIAELNPEGGDKLEATHQSSDILSAIENLTQCLASENGEGNVSNVRDGGNVSNGRNGVHEKENMLSNGKVGDEDILSPCPCESVPPLGTVTASCPPDALTSLAYTNQSQSLTDSSHSASECSQSASNATVVNLTNESKIGTDSTDSEEVNQRTP